MISLLPVIYLDPGWLQPPFVNTHLSISHNSNYNNRDIRSTCITSTVVIRILQPIHPSILIIISIPPVPVVLKFSLADSPRTQIEEWFEDFPAKARGQCVQWDQTGAIFLIASDAVWNAIPGNAPPQFGSSLG